MKSSGHRLSIVEKQEIVKAYQAGEPLKEIVSRFDINTSTVYNLSKSAGVFRESRRLKALEINAQAFDLPAGGEYTADQKYWAGMLLADGNIHQPKQGSCLLSFGLQAGDEAHVRAFADFIDYPQDSVRWSESSTQWVVQARSPQWPEALAPFGIIPQKSLTAIVPEWLQCDRDFLRGYIDGNGTVRWSSHTPPAPSVQVCGVKTACHAVVAMAQHLSPGSSGSEKQEGKIWKASVNGRHAKIFAGWLYQDGDTALQRKVKIANEFAAWDLPLCSICGDPMQRGGFVEQLGYHQKCDVRSYKAAWKKQKN